MKRANFIDNECEDENKIFISLKRKEYNIFDTTEEMFNEGTVLASRDLHDKFAVRHKIFRFVSKIQ